MAKPKGMQGMHGKTDRKTRGRTAARNLDAGGSTRPNVPQEVRGEANRPVSAGSGRHRGDRRDTSPTYTGNRKHAARGSDARKDVTTRKR
jgi:hypothetical protein